MRPRYAVPGLFWDSMPCAPLPVKEHLLGLPPSIETPRNLFDIECYRRTLRLSVLLAASSLDAVDDVVLTLAECDEIVIVDDCRPRASGLVSQRFHDERISQVIGYVSLLLPSTNVRLTEAGDVA